MKQTIMQKAILVLGACLVIGSVGTPATAQVPASNLTTRASSSPFMAQFNEFHQSVWLPLVLTRLTQIVANSSISTPAGQPRITATSLDYPKLYSYLARANSTQESYIRTNLRLQLTRVVSQWSMAKDPKFIQYQCFARQMCLAKYLPDGSIQFGLASDLSTRLTDEQWNVLLQHEQANLDAFLTFLKEEQGSGTGSPYALLATKLASLEAQDDLRRHTPRRNLQTGAVEIPIPDQMVPDADGIRVPRLGNLRKPIERVTIIRHPTIEVDAKNGRKYHHVTYDAQSVINHGATTDNALVNYEYNGQLYTSTKQDAFVNDENSSVRIRTIRETIAVPPEIQIRRSFQYDLKDQAMGQTIDYYIDEDVKKYGPLEGQTVEQTKNGMRVLAEAATRIIGDPYIGYTLGNSFARTTNTIVLDLIRGNILRGGPMNLAAYYTALQAHADDLLRVSTGANPADVARDFAQSAADLTIQKNRVFAAGGALIAGAIVQITLAGFAIDAVKDLTPSVGSDEVSQDQIDRAVRMFYKQQFVNIGGGFGTIGAAAVWASGPALIKSQAQWAKDRAPWIPRGFLTTDTYAFGSSVAQGSLAWKKVNAMPAGPAKTLAGIAATMHFGVAGGRLTAAVGNFAKVLGDIQYVASKTNMQERWLYKNSSWLSSIGTTVASGFAVAHLICSTFAELGI